MPSGFTIDFGNFDASIDELKARVNVATRDAVALGGHEIEREAKLQFNPGSGGAESPHVGSRPNVISGTLRRSIKLIPDSPFSTGLGQWQVSVAPTTIYGRRVELGFTGQDSLGRVYGPPANPARYPYLKPGLDKALPILPRIFTDTWRAALTR